MRITLLVLLLVTNYQMGTERGNGYHVRIFSQRSFASSYNQRRGLVRTLLYFMRNSLSIDFQRNNRHRKRDAFRVFCALCAEKNFIKPNRM